LAEYLAVHPQNPQPRLIQRAAEMIRSGALAIFPTDSSYALGGHLGDAALLERIRRIRGVDHHHHFTLICRDLSEIATYARVDNAQYRMIKAATPGPYAFILEGTKELPRRVLHPRRKTLGLRVPDHPVVRALLAALGEPILSSTLILPGEREPLSDPDEISHRLHHQVDLIIDAGCCASGMTTVINLVGGGIELVRAGKGALEPFGLAAD
jgi:tRNA threonylcarbamoyl adenosine modification protein (Sua5/YciO/YrdC/YwlC family)